MWGNEAAFQAWQQHEDFDRALHEYLLSQAIASKNLEHAREIILKSSCKSTNHIRFDQHLACRLLSLAIEVKHEQYVHDLIAQIPSLHTQQGGELIWQALTTWNVKIASLLIEAGADVNVPKPNDPKRLTLLQHVAQQRNNREASYNLAELLMDHGARVDEVNERGNTALHYAVTPHKRADRYSYVIAAALLHRGARVDIVNASGKSAVRIAMKNFWFDGQLAPLLIAMARDVDDEVKCRWILDALVIVTKRERDYDTAGLRSLLELGFPVLKLQGLFDDLWKPLYFAVLLRKNEQMEILVEYGSNVNSKVPYLNQIPTILHLALHYNMSDTVELLIKRGADVRAINEVSREQPIHIACGSTKASIENVRLLLRLGAEVNVFDKNGKTPYSLIDSSPLSDHLRECLIEQFAVLQEKGIKISKRDWKNIQGQPGMLRYYRRCVDELQRMKNVVINNDISLLSVLVENVERLSRFARNAKFAENFDRNKEKIRAVFPVYFRELEYKVRMAEARKNVLVLREEALLGRLNLPYLVVEKIVEYASLDELRDFEKNYHVSMIKK